jgi:DNA-binding response OmpR family regulator
MQTGGVGQEMASKAEGHTVLVADDEPEVVNLVRIMLEMEGYTVLEASDGQEALTTIRTQKPALVLLDVRMPKMSGLDVLVHLRKGQDTASIPVIMLSVVTTYPEVQQALDQGAIAYLPKPFELREMVRLVGQVIAMEPAQREALRQNALRNVGRKW